MTHRYGRYDGGPDPLAGPLDVAGAVDDLGEAVLDGADPGTALRDLLRHGRDGLPGLQDLLRRVRRRREELQRSGRLDGTLEEVRRLLADAIAAERAALAAEPGPDAAARSDRLDDLPPGTAAAVADLRDYDWRSPEASEAFARIDDLLQRDLVQAQFRGMRDALRSPDANALDRVKEMLADLNAMLAADARGEHTQADFEKFMERHGDLLGETPADLEELLESLARRAAAAQRVWDSLDEDQRAELADLMAQATSDLDLQRELDQLNAALRSARPDLFSGGGRRVSGGQPLGLGEATDLLEELRDLDGLAEALAGDYPGASLDDVDEEAVRRALGRRAVDDLDALKRLERELQRAGFLQRAGGDWELTPKAIRRIGQSALRQIFSSLSGGRRGDHDIHDAGAAGELTGSSRPWRFGDEQPIDVVRTVGNALRRGDGRDGRLRLTADDFEVRETERRTRAAVALLVDQSFSMVLNDTWRDAKRTALALHALSTGQFPQDALTIIGFANLARTIDASELAGLEVPGFQGTNLQHALMLAGRFLDRHPDAEPVVMVVTDGEPTAHLTRDGDWSFSYPPAPETLALTFAEVDRLTRRGASLSIFRLGDEPRLARFCDALARRNGGRVIAAASDRLGDYVVTDYVSRRSRSRRRAG